MKIDNFKGKYRFLSNFHLHDVEFEGLVYPSVENAYQAAKTLNLTKRQYFSEPVVTSRNAKQAGNKLNLREDWENVKVGIMRELTIKKFSIPELKIKLLETGDAELVEGNTWNDKFWGICNGEGQNWLGKILMEVREILKKE